MYIYIYALYDSDDADMDSSTRPPKKRAKGGEGFINIVAPNLLSNAKIFTECII